MAFDYDLDFDHINFRKQPEKYRVGRGEQGVLMVEPYKGEILPHWRFKTPEIAKESSEKIYKMFESMRKTMISLEWIWHGNSFRWAIQERVDMRTTKAERNTTVKVT